MCEEKSFGGATVVVVTVPRACSLYVRRSNCLAITMLLHGYRDERRRGTVTYVSHHGLATG